MINRLREALDYLCKFAPADGDGQTDGQLLARFVLARDERAFASLVQRHGPLVFGVCRRVLRHDQDAEDAFQATFLVLARRAASVRWQPSVAGWLYEVAHRLALKARAARRPRPQPPATRTGAADPAIEAACREVCAVLDAELRRLPERFRAPLLLCYLEGKTRDEAAQQLGWTLGRLRDRLERGRRLLRYRLAARGVTLSAGLLAALAHGAAPGAARAVVDATVKTAVLAASGVPATGTVSSAAEALARGMTWEMFLTRARVVAAVLLLVGLAGAGAGLLAQQALADRPAEPRKDDAPSAPPQKASAPPRADRYGDPL